MSPDTVCQPNPGPPPAAPASPASPAQIISLVALLLVLAFMAFLFFRVVADFLFPMFMAVLLVVIFKPLHSLSLRLCRGRQHLAAALTTAIVFLVFLVPLLTILIQGSSEGAAMYHHLKNGKGAQATFESAAAKVQAWGNRFGVDQKVEEIKNTISSNFQDWLAPIALGTTQFVGNFLIGILVMSISLYFFLADGRGMVDNLIRWSPLDERNTRELVERFTTVSRAVVLATLISAVAQGLLAGIAYYIVGLQPVFLLIVLTMILSMVPFVGAFSVWVPACLWVYFHDERTGAAIALAVYAVIVVNVVDNVVKPAVLHGRSQLHPLLALLSVMGGIKALGPIGIFVGPMVVAFMQTLLEMLHNTIQEMGPGGSMRMRPNAPTQPMGDTVDRRKTAG